ncbi:MAG: homocysteine S-methyltransferase family protein [Eubacteriales bacterium]
MNICELIKTRRVYFDGGMGTMLQARGLEVGELPELWSLTHPDIITDIHRQYLLSGANIITTNTFGVNALKHGNYAELIRASVRCAKEAARGFENAFVALDIGPIGKFLEPIGDIAFEDAVEVFSKNVRVAKECGADLVIIETMSDSYETKAAVLAVKENSDLPIFVTNVYDENGKMLTGATPEAMVAMLEGLGVDAIGANCSLGPDKMLPIIKRIADCSSLPVIANPNAGLPEVVDGKAHYFMKAEEFASHLELLARAGANILGGCCGTEPDFIRETVRKTAEIPLNPNEDKNISAVSSYTHAVVIDKEPILIGERINPTGKPKFRQALRDGNIPYILEQAVTQVDAGVHLLDINVGLPEIDEVSTMKSVVQSIQAICDTPLQLDSNDPKVLEASMRLYNGKPLINSVNGDCESMDAIFPLIKKYGGAAVALTLDSSGIPATAEGRVAIAKRIIHHAESCGIDKKDLIFDPLAMSVSTDAKSAEVTLETLGILHEMGLHTCLGISNISFGLPNRALINSTFFSLALSKGLSCAIINPLSDEMMNAYHSYRVLRGLDASCADFIAYAQKSTGAAKVSVRTESSTLKEAIVKGLTALSVEKTKELLLSAEPLEIINLEIIPALDEVGVAFEEQKLFLPALLMSAECASKAFSLIKEKFPKAQSRGKGVILATVKGDIHDIGKNIVKLLLESYGFDVYDLGKDVAPETVLDAVKKYSCKLVGLSALMTTTLPAMKETVKLLHSYDADIRVIVGGAVLTREYADMIGADAYSKQALNTVKFAEEYYK